MDNAIFKKRFYAITGAGACLLLALVWAYIKGGLSPRGFAAGVLVYWIAMFGAFFILLRSKQRSDKEAREKKIANGIAPEALDRDECIKNIRAMKIGIAMWVVVLAYGLFTTQGDPLLPRVAGGGFDLFLLVVCARALIRSRKRLKEIAAQSTTQSSDASAQVPGA